MFRVFLFLVGIISLLLGLLGILLPGLPTTPFLLLSAACFMRSSERAYNMMLQNKITGPFIRDYREKKAIPLKSKIIGVALLWLSIGFTVLFVLPMMWVKLLLVVIAVLVTLFILKIKTLTADS